MFDKRLMLMCPESKKYILGNILLQFLELCLNAAMIVTIAISVQKLYDGTWKMQNLPLPMLIIFCTVILRFFIIACHMVTLRQQNPHAPKNAFRHRKA